MPKNAIKSLVCTLGRIFMSGDGHLPMNPKKVLIFKIGAIGDVMMTTPLVRALRKRFPKAKLDYLVGKWSASIIEKNKNLDEMITFDDTIFFRRKKRELLRLAKEIRKRYYDLIIVLDRSWLVNIYARLFSAPTIGFDRDGEGFANNVSVLYDDEKHDIEYYLDIARRLKCKKETQKMDLFLDKKAIAFADMIWKKHRLAGKSVVCIIPGGGSNPGQTVDLKRWPIGKYALLAEEIIKSRKTIILLGGESDTALKKHFRHLPKDKVIDLIGKCDINESASVMARCSTVICNDSGPMHIASAVTKRVIAIFGPTDPVKLGPLGKKDIVLKKDIPCRPCYHDGIFTDCKHHQCMRWITVDEVLKHV